MLAREDLKQILMVIGSGIGLGILMLLLYAFVRFA